MKWLKNQSLQKRISLLVFTGLIVGLGLFSWLGIQSVNESVQRTLDERLIIARVVANQIDGNNEHVLMHLQNTAKSHSGLFNKEQFIIEAGWLRNTLADSEISVIDIILVDQDGEIQLTYLDDAINVMGNVGNYTSVIESLETGAHTISNLVTGPTGTPVVLLSTPVSNKAGRIIGALVVSIDIENSNISASSQDVILGKTGYTEIVDGNGIILARTNPASPPKTFERSDHPGKFAELISRGEATVGVCHRCHETREIVERQPEEPPLTRDMLAFAPLSTASWGVAIRQSEEEALAPSLQLRQRLLLSGMVVVIITILLVWTMMQDIVKPIRLLTSAAKRVAAGEFKVTIPIKSQDEIGQLGSAFHSMTQDLAKSRHELTKSRDELMVRNEELSALNSIAGQVNQSLNLEDVLGNTMQKVLDITGATTGCTFLRVSNGNKLEMRGGIGLTSIFKCRQSNSSTADCSCHQVIRDGQTVMVNDVFRCPMLTEDLMMRENISSFVCVPLKAKDRILGVMNIACRNERPFTENDFMILDSIAYHIGLAIENSFLYEEAKKKEELRGQLLNRVINAQEEERKRIARELHDEYGQSLTVLKMDLESLENIAMSKQPQFREKLKHAGALVSEALEDLRRLTLDLRPYALDQLGLIAALRAYAQTHLEAAGIQVKFKTKGLSQRLAAETETVLFRIIQEAINNIVKHAEAHNVGIQLEAKADKITIIIHDDGKGLDVDTIFRPKDGTQPLGLLGIQERSTLLGGTFKIESSPGQGTRLIVEIPVASSVGDLNQVKK